MELIPLIDIVFETDRLAVRRWRHSTRGYKAFGAARVR
jgi:hypothetical protein